MVLMNRKVFNRITEQFRESSLFHRVVSLIVHGSTLFSPARIHADKDIDLELILDNYFDNDYKVIKRILHHFKIPIECQIRYKNEIQDNSSLIWRSGYKIFMFFTYSNGICLIGENIYKNILAKIPAKLLERSLLISMQINFKDIRKSYLNNSSAYVVNKNIARTFFNMLLYKRVLKLGDLGTKKYFLYERQAFIPLILKYHSDFLTKDERSKLKTFRNYFRRRILYQPIFSIVNKIAEDFSKRI